MSNPIVKVKQGELKGVINKTKGGKEYYSFLGIPYAEPPVGKLKFKDPVPAKNWDGIKNATKEGNICGQIDMFTQEYLGDDDCLFINVHTPQLNNLCERPLPVMVHIHGGGFVNWSGNAALFGPDYIVEKDVILISFNYRLGLLGFLCTDPINARGDMGLMDQQLALKWVQENIETFNGDRKNITVFGISAGSASIEYHLLSKKSHGLYHKAILQSGSIFNAWARNKNPINNAERLAQILGYSSSNTERLFEFLNKFDSKTLCMASKSVLNNDDLKNGSFFPFYPVINEFKDGKGFLTEEPIDLLNRGDFNRVPIISGISEIEGLMIRKFYENEEMDNLLNNGSFEEFIPSFLNRDFDPVTLKAIYRKRIDDKNENDYILNFLSDLSFVGGCFKSLELRLKHNFNNEYFYKFAYDGNMNLIKILLQCKEIGACHADDYTYLGPNVAVSQENATPQDIITRDRMVKMWTDFARFGNPTPKLTENISVIWEPTSKNNFQYLEITDELKMSNELWLERRQFWQELYKKM